MMQSRPFSEVLQKVRKVGLRPTRQRLALARLLFDQGNRHVTAEALHGEAKAAKIPVSLATIYNTLNQFRDAGLLREVVVDSQRTYFDTNTAGHYHFFDETTGVLIDISGDDIAFLDLPSPPEGTAISRVDVVIRLRSNLPT